MSNDKKTQRCMCVTIDFEQLTFGELRKFVELTADREDDEFVCVNDNDGVPDGFMAYVDAETIDVVPTDETSERYDFSPEKLFAEICAYLDTLRRMTIKET